jgi:hypothetical protein
MNNQLRKLGRCTEDAKWDNGSKKLRKSLKELEPAVETSRETQNNFFSLFRIRFNP